MQETTVITGTKIIADLLTGEITAARKIIMTAVILGDVMTNATMIMTTTMAGTDTKIKNYIIKKAARYGQLFLCQKLFIPKRLLGLTDGSYQHAILILLL